MKTVLLDLGNSRWKIARATAGGVTDVASGAHADLPALRAALQGHAGAGRVVLASVAAPQVTGAALALAGEVLGCAVRRVAATDPMPGVVSGYQRPEQLGVDRLLAMVAAYAHCRSACCVVDAGTAATIDFVDQHGRHLGGFILPGLTLARDCLLANTAIPRDSAVDERAKLGRDTPTAVAMAARQGIAALVERFTSGSESLTGDDPVTVFLTGGDAACLLGLMPSPCVKIDELVLRGLALVAASD